MSHYKFRIQIKFPSQFICAKKEHIDHKLGMIFVVFASQRKFRSSRPNHFLENKNEQEQITYVIGFSSSAYLKQAFSKEPILVQFKDKNKNWYDNSVGLINEH